VEQILNKEQKDFFSGLLANPRQVSAVHATPLKALVDSYPQSGILRALLARASQLDDPSAFQQKLKSASVYAPDRIVLYNLINHPQLLIKPGDSPEAVFIEQQLYGYDTIEDTDKIASANYFHETEGGGHASSEIDDEVYDEITGIEDIQFDTDRPKSSDEQRDNATGDTGLEEILLAQYGWAANADKSDVALLSDPPPAALNLNEPVKSEDYSFSNNSFKNRMSSSVGDEQEYENEDDEPITTEPAPAIVNTQTDIELHRPVEEDDLRVSRYNDDKLPYSFMWWLDRTRREHADSHQPYVSHQPVAQAVAPPAVADELQQQYYENIFHLTTIEELDKNVIKPVADLPKPPADDVKRKEEEIIERFIQEDPQIKPPSNEKLDNENKAKKSAEDEDELVSETLARIYLDQMLYHKAISTYQKLLLKFPEKSSYFVAQIKLLEKKIN